MLKVVQLNADWRRWIQENLGRGVPEATMIPVLQENGFDLLSCQQFMADTTLRLRQQQAARLLQKACHPNYFLSAPEPCKHTGVVLEADFPQLVVYANVLSGQECDQLIALSQDKLKPSETVDDTTGGHMRHPDRTSEGTAFDRCENALIAEIDQRLARLSNLPLENGEGLQILHYRQGGEYKPHYDYFDPDTPAGLVHLKTGGQRMVTIILYLNDVEAGGETIFPNAGLKIRPVKGSALYFSYFQSGMTDPMSLHGGAPVLQGEKWIATRWIRQGKY
jgi:prolyl 4-hydroxylase